MKSKEQMVNHPSYSNLETTSYRNYASLLHLSGLSIVTGIPFINVIIPACLWLIYKDKSPNLDLHGRIVINFQLTIILLQIGLLSLGVFLIWLTPELIRDLLNATRTMKIVFATAYNLPFNLFTFVPFIFALMIGLSGAVAAYHGKIAPSLFGFKFLATEIAAVNPARPQSPPPPTAPSINPQTTTTILKRSSFG